MSDAPSDGLIEAIVQGAVRDVAELPDRTSPRDQPEMMLVTAEELEDIIGAAITSQKAIEGEGGDAEIAAQLRKLLAAYPLGTMDWPLDVMANAAAALEHRAVVSSGHGEAERRDPREAVGGAAAGRSGDGGGKE